MLSKHYCVELHQIKILLFKYICKSSPPIKKNHGGDEDVSGIDGISRWICVRAMAPGFSSRSGTRFRSLPLLSADLLQQSPTQKPF